MRKFPYGLFGSTIVTSAVRWCGVARNFCQKLDHFFRPRCTVIITNPWWLCWGSCSTLPITLGAYAPELGEEASGTCWQSWANLKAQWVTWSADWHLEIFGQAW